MTSTSTRTAAGTWWWPAGDDGHQRAVLFFPPSGAEPSVVQPLLKQAGGLRFGVAQLPGRGSRHAEPAPTDVLAVVEELADSIEHLGGPPPVLVGHSLGGLIAYGVTAALEARGFTVARLIPVASQSPSSWTAELAEDRRRYPGEGRSGFIARRSARLLAGTGVLPGIMDHPEFADRARRLVEVDVGLSHQGFADDVITTPVTSIVARDDTMLQPSAVAGWADVSRGGYRRVDVPGDHFFYRAEPWRLMTPVRMEVQGLDSALEPW